MPLASPQLMTHGTLQYIPVRHYTAYCILYDKTIYRTRHKTCLVPVRRKPFGYNLRKNTAAPDLGVVADEERVVITLREVSAHVDVRRGHGRLRVRADTRVLRVDNTCSKIVVTVVHEFTTEKAVVEEFKTVHGVVKESTTVQAVVEELATVKAVVEEFATVKAVVEEFATVKAVPEKFAIVKTVVEEFTTCLLYTSDAADE